jgi:hypothetical protein
MSAPSTALVDLQSPDLQQPRQHFTPDQAGIPGCEHLREKPLSTAALIEQAAMHSGLPVAAFVHAAVVDAARKRIIDHHRAKAGATNAKGAADEKIAAAIATLRESKIPVTAARVRSMTGCNRLAVLRYLDANPSITTTNVE